ncbi:MAG TPA: hypothetical protein VHH34_24055 [Pseudonocardiaceae bacterium]|nr:hypothetical protein [Pseudonocardiaceae bacterium]
MTASSVSGTDCDQLRTVVAGRTVVLVTADQAAGESVLHQLNGLDADRILVLGPPGLASPATAVDAELVEVDLGDDDPVATRQRWEMLLDDPPSGLRNLLDARDPRHTALILVSPWLARAELLGRPVFGAPQSGWTTAEDTLLAERLWAPAGDPSNQAAAVLATGP